MRDRWEQQLTDLSYKWPNGNSNSSAGVHMSMNIILKQPLCDVSLSDSLDSEVVQKGVL